MNQLISASVNIVVHSIFYNNHLHNVWLKNVFDSLNDLLREHISDSLDKVAPELSVSPGFVSLDCAFEKKTIVSLQIIPRSWRGISSMYDGSSFW